jgi:hypothetical protein
MHAPSGMGSVGPGGWSVLVVRADVFALDADGIEVRRPLPEALDVAFERSRPVRSFPSYTGGRNFPGFYYAACTGCVAKPPKG